MERLKRTWLGRNFSITNPAQGIQHIGKNATWPDDFNNMLRSLQTASIAAALINRECEFTKVNQSFCDLLGYSDHDLVSKNIQEFMGLDNSESVSTLFHFQSNATESFCCDRHFLHKNGRSIWLNIRVSRMEDDLGLTYYLITLLTDITEYKQLEENLRQTRNLLQGVVAGTPDAFFIKDRNGRYLVINTIGAQLYGRTIDEIIGKNDIELLSPDHTAQMQAIDRQVLTTGETQTYELAITNSGQMRAFLFTKAPYRNHRGEIIGLVGVGHDITEHQRAAENLENSRAELRALSARLQSIREDERMRIAREIHDELGQVLTGLKIDVVSLAKKLSDINAKAEFGQLMEKTQSIANLINSAILTVRKISTELRPGLLDALGLIAAIEWQAKEFEKRTGIKCRLKLPPDSVVLDQNRSIAIFRIFQEIMTNVARHSLATEVSINIEDREDYLHLEARDNGRGIRASEFSNPKSLGLLGMRERALLLGGEVSIRGVQGKGTTVLLRVPFQSNNDAEGAYLQIED